MKSDSPPPSEKLSENSPEATSFVRRPAIPRWLSSMTVTLAVAGMIYLFQTEDQTTTNAGLLSGSNGAKGSELDQHTIAGTISPANTLSLTENDLLGTWILDDGMVKRVITMEPDGTASMQVEFDFFTSLRYGSKMELDLEWTLAGNVLQQTIVDGSPESGKKTLISDFGDTATYDILEFKDGKMRLEEYTESKENYVWKKVDEE